MSLRLAAVVWVLTERIIRGVKDQHDTAGEVLKAYFRRTGRRSYRGITFSTAPHSYLSARAARAALGPKRAAACTRVATRESLHLPSGVEPIVPAELSALVEGR